MRRMPRRRTTRRTGLYHVVLRDENHFVVSAGVPFKKAWQFKLKEFTQAQNWDYYRINWIGITFTPEQSNTFTRPDELNVFNFGWIDYDDTTDPVSADINRQNLKKWSASRTQSFKIYPRCLASRGVNTPTQTERPLNSIQKPGWMNTAYNEVIHLGLKTIFSDPKSVAVPVTTARPLHYNVGVKCYVSFKQPILSEGV
uniref:Capsid protein n=1 Tax=Werosea circovirus TaxID=2682467 RepID=A0A7S5KZR8_9CIRC|nr:capsid protein [Werosea circovirus]